MVEMAMVRANWRYICPVMPGRKAAGTNTANSTRVVATTGPETSLMALMAASLAFRPRSMWRHGGFHHHDGIVHHDANGKHQAEEGQHVEREAHHQHDRQGADEGYRDRHRRNHGGPPVLEKEEEHQEDQARRLETG